MSSRFTRTPWAVLVAATLLAGSWSQGEEISEGDRALFEASDYTASLPDPFRAVLELGSQESRKTRQVEMWRLGEDVLVRFLEQGEQGKFYLRLGSSLYFLAPGASRPVALGRGHRLWGGATFTEILGGSLTQDYTLVGVQRQASSGRAEDVVLTYQLAAAREDVPYSRAKLVASALTGKALRLELYLPSGKPARMVEIKEWSGETPGELVVKDLLGRHAPLTVKVLELHLAEVPEALFHLEDGEARQQLPHPGENPE